MNITPFWNQFANWITHLPAWFRDIKVTDIWNYQTAFNNYPPAVWRFAPGYVALIVIFFVWGVWVFFRRHQVPHYRSMVLGFCLTNVILGAVLAFFRWQQVPLMGMDSLRSLHLIAMVIWLFFILKYRFFNMKNVVFQEKLAERKNKYLPKARQAI